MNAIAITSVAADRILQLRLFSLLVSIFLSRSFSSSLDPSLAPRRSLLRVSLTPESITVPHDTPKGHTYTGRLRATDCADARRFAIDEGDRGKGKRGRKRSPVHTIGSPGARDGAYNYNAIREISRGRIVDDCHPGDGRARPGVPFRDGSGTRRVTRVANQMVRGQGASDVLPLFLFLSRSLFLPPHRWEIESLALSSLRASRPCPRPRAPRVTGETGSALDACGLACRSRVGRASGGGTAVGLVDPMVFHRKERCSGRGLSISR